MGAKDISKTMVLRDGVTNTLNKINGGVVAYKNNLQELKGIANAAWAAAAVGIAAAGAAMVKFGDEATEASAKLKNATGATGAELAGLQDVTNQLFKDSRLTENMESAAAAVIRVSQATGFTGAALKDATKNALLLQKTFGEDVKETIDASSKLMKNLGVSSTEAQNLIAQGFQKGLNKSGDFLDTLNEYTPHFKAIGLSAEEMLSVLNSGLKSGARNTDMVADAIKEFVIKTKDGSKTTTEAFKTIRMEGIDKEFAAGGEAAKAAFQKVMTALGGIQDPLLKNTVGVQLFGTKWEDLESVAVAALSNIDTGFSRLNQTMQDIDTNQPKTVTSILSDIGRAIITDVLAPINQGLAPQLAVLVQGISSVADTIKNNWSFIGPFVYGIAAALGAFTLALVVSKAATLAVTAATWAWSTALKMTPLGWISFAIGLVIAAGTYLIANWELVKLKGMEVWNVLVDAAEWAANKYFTFVNTVLKVYVYVWDSIKYAGIVMWNALVEAEQAGITAFITAANNVAKAFIFSWEKVKEAGKSVWNALVGFAEAGANSFIGILEDMIKGTVGGINTLITEAKNLAGKAGINLGIGTVEFKGLDRVNFGGAKADEKPVRWEDIPDVVPQISIAAAKANAQAPKWREDMNILPQANFQGGKFSQDDIMAQRKKAEAEQNKKESEKQAQADQKTDELIGALNANTAATDVNTDSTKENTKAKLKDMTALEIADSLFARVERHAWGSS
ncbi:phage tail tape measure protein [Paenibacillus oleatilyticus]|uniref:phage tail tape measure protein n=1 Tax=Paenibacillus oleatilyticus TaxID=2594886 RepID=UPI001C20133B|nr:phage tail tape measure protein [Paenibacillus oleatilyticus]MBU7320273.1 phage tail tape measure protein [Paenibacillus oleatilyticus]